MFARALIIAIENYPHAENGPAKVLPGTLQSGLAFQSWLKQKWSLEGVPQTQTQILFLSNPKQPGGAGANQPDILKALRRLKEDGRGMTDELYVFFSGHGFAFVERPGSVADVIIAADFVDREISGASCLNLDQIIGWLRDHLGPGRHFYFVDACRNKLTGNDIRVGDLLPTDINATAEASTFVLQSTVDGATAAVGGMFQSALLAGLEGKGLAKVWDSNLAGAMLVSYESLSRYVVKALKARQAVTSRAEGEVTPGEAVLATIRPIPLHKLTVTISDARPGDEGILMIKRGRSTGFDEVKFRQTPISQMLEPDEYSVAIRLRRGMVTPNTPASVSLFEDQSIQFQRDVASRPRAFRSIAALARSIDAVVAENIADVDVLIIGDTKITLQNLATGDMHFVSTASSMQLPGGDYIASLLSKDDSLLKNEVIALRGGESSRLNLSAWQSSLPKRSIAKYLPTRDGVPDISKSLDNALADPDLGLWLALIGAGRILGSQGDYSRIAGLPLRNFSDVEPGSSPTYVLAGFENEDTILEVSVSRTPRPNWRIARKAMDGIYEAYFPAKSGSQLVTFRIDGQASYTVASFNIPNRAALITLTMNDKDELSIGQYLLPVGHLISEFPIAMQHQIRHRNHLKDVRFLAQASRAFQKRRLLENEFKSEELRELLYAKWLDPIGSSLASYEVLRRGRRDQLGEVIRNMKSFFPKLPDTAALATLVGVSTRDPKSPPLFLDGLRAYPKYADWLPLPASHLDFNSTWTAWRAAVN